MVQREWILFFTAWGWSALQWDPQKLELYRVVLPVPGDVHTFATRYLHPGTSAQKIIGPKETVLPVIHEIRSYFAGHIILHWGGITLNLDRLSPFSRKVLALVQKIPYGHTMTYGEIAASLGVKRGARAVGRVMSQNPIPLIIPCHRVVAQNGPGGFSSYLGTERKQALLKMESENRSKKPRA